MGKHFWTAMVLAYAVLAVLAGIAEDHAGVLASLAMASAAAAHGRCAWIEKYLTEATRNAP